MLKVLYSKANYRYDFFTAGYCFSLTSALQYVQLMYLLFLFADSEKRKPFVAVLAGYNVNAYCPYYP